MAGGIRVKSGAAPKTPTDETRTLLRSSAVPMEVRSYPFRVADHPAERGRGAPGSAKGGPARDRGVPPPLEIPEKTRFLFVTGGVISSLGKGIASASVGRLLKSQGYTVSFLKLDPYLNVDPGTMSPYQHGEVFVTHDGAETDLDLGHYERFTGGAFSSLSNVTSGQIYEQVIERERQGGYLGATVQVVPHVTDEIKRRVNAVAVRDGADVVIAEIGGTIGDIEGQPFLEAARQFRLDAGADRVCFLHLTLVPMIRTAGEYKTKPTQHSVRELRAIGIQPDVLLCRAEEALPADIKAKIGLHTSVSADAVFTAVDARSVYEVPLNLAAEGVDTRILRHFRLPSRERQLDEWRALVERLHTGSRDVRIAVVGKYVEHKDSYKSLGEALLHGGVPHGARVSIRWIEAESLEGGDLSQLDDCDGILVPGGFGRRGTEGMAAAAGRARRSRVPFFGICYGFQWALVEFARSRCGLTGASTEEIDPESPHQVFALLRDLEGAEPMGGTMRVGAVTCLLEEGSLAAQVYGTTRIRERHRHRYEFHHDYEARLTAEGMRFSGSTEDGFFEVCEIPDHPWFLAVQFHPEFQSNPLRPHPLFREFIGAALERREGLANAEAAPLPASATA